MKGCFQGSLFLFDSNERNDRPLDIFKLFGTIAINNQDANNSIDETTGKASGAQTKMVDAFKKIGTAVATYFAVDKIVAFGREVVNVTASFEDAMLKVQSLSGATQEEYQKLSEAALDYGSKTAWTSKDVADAMGYMALAGFETSEILASTSGMLSLASASGEDLATVTDILTDSMTGFGDSADQASRYADVLATVQAKSNTTVGLLGEAFKYVSPLAGSYGYALEDVATALGLMANSGVKGSMAGTALSAIMTRLATDAGASSNKLGALGTLTEKCGVEFYNADGSARNLSDVLKELCDATQDMTVEEKSAIASVIAGQEAQKGLLAILNQGSAAYEDLRLKLTDCEGSASFMAENMESGIGGAIRNVQSAIEGFKISLGQKFSEPLGNLIRNIADWVNGTLTPSIDTVIDVSSELFATIAPAAEGLGRAVNYLVDSFKPVIEIFGKLLPASVKEVTAMDVVSGIFKMIGDVTQQVTKKLYELGLWIRTHIPEIREIIYDLWKDVLFVWNTVGQPLFDLVQDAIEIVREAFAERMPEIKEFVGQCFEDISVFWERNLKPCLEAIGNFIENVLAPVFKEVFTNFIGPAIDEAFNLIKSLWENTLKPVFTGITDFLTGVFTLNFKQAFEGVVKIVDGIFSGLEDVIRYPINQVINLVNSFIKGLNKLEIPDWVPLVGGESLDIPLIPKLEKGGILDKGQIGFLEGNGAEAVVPLDKNQAWISAVARDMEAEGIGGNNQQSQRIVDLLEMLVEMLPDTMKDAFASMKFDVNNREFARLVKAVG